MEEVFRNNSYIIGSIKNKTAKFLKNVSDVSLFKNSSISLHLHLNMNIENKQFRFIINIEVIDINYIQHYYYKLILCLDSKQTVIKNELMHELSLCYYLVELKNNYRTILKLKEKMSRHILENIYFNQLFLKPDMNIIEKINYILKFDLPYEILEIIIIYMF
jgi:hypothetical protein